MLPLTEKLPRLFGALAPLRGALGSGLLPFSGLGRRMGAQPTLPLPVNDATSDARDLQAAHDLGLRHARQEMWAELGATLRDADRRRARTESGTMLPMAMARGAGADVVGPVCAALSDPGLMSAHAPRAGMIALAEVLGDVPDDYGVALVVANAHIDIGWAWRGQGWISEVPERHWAEFHHHFDQAAEILDGYDAFELDSPALAAARCALLAARPAPRARVADDYEDLIDLDPENPRHMRALGVHLLPRWFGSYDQLETEARRTAARTDDVWGMGGYAWVYLEAIATDPRAVDRVVADDLVQGVIDIVIRRPDPHTVNLWAAFCGVTLTGAKLAKSTCATELHAALMPILRPRLTELHPLVWGQAAYLAQNGARADMQGVDLAGLGVHAAALCLSGAMRA